MKKILVIAVSLFVTNIAFAKKNCTDQPRDKWMKIEDFKKMMIKKGFQIRKFKQPGTCYEIYGKNKEGQKVEVYFNPVDGSIVKYERDD